MRNKRKNDSTHRIVPVKIGKICANNLDISITTVSK